MCLAVPARIKSINGIEAEVEIGGITRKTSLMLTPEAKIGDYVLLHACLLYTSPSPRDLSTSRMPSSA